MINRLISLILLSYYDCVGAETQSGYCAISCLQSYSVDVVVLGPSPALPPAAINTFLDGIINNIAAFSEHNKTQSHTTRNNTARRKRAQIRADPDKIEEKFDSL